jgi:hypothetical protein
LSKKVFAFQPAMAMFLGHVSDQESTSRYWTKMMRRGTLPDIDYFHTLAERTGVTAETGPNEARRRMRPVEGELLQWVYSSFVQECRQRHIVPVFVYMQLVTEPAETWRAQDREHVLRTAKEAGFTVINLTGTYDGYAPTDLWIAEGDGHPNALGNRLVAQKLYALLAQSHTLAMGPSPTQ